MNQRTRHTRVHTKSHYHFKCKLYCNSKIWHDVDVFCHILCYSYRANELNLSGFRRANAIASNFFLKGKFSTCLFDVSTWKVNDKKDYYFLFFKSKLIEQIKLCRDTRLVKKKLSTHCTWTFFQKTEDWLKNFQCTLRVDFQWKLPYIIRYIRIFVHIVYILRLKSNNWQKWRLSIPLTFFTFFASLYFSLNKFHRISFLTDFHLVYLRFNNWILHMYNPNIIVEFLL